MINNTITGIASSINWTITAPNIDLHTTKGAVYTIPGDATIIADNERLSLGDLMYWLYGSKTQPEFRLLINKQVIMVEFTSTSTSVQDRV